MIASPNLDPSNFHAGERSLADALDHPILNPVACFVIWRILCSEKADVAVV